MKKIEELLEERKDYPIGIKDENENQLDYILNKIKENRQTQFLILRSFFLQKDNKTTKEIKKLIFYHNYFLKSIIDLGEIWQRHTSLNFNLIIITKDKPERITFCKCPVKKTFKADRSISTGEISSQTPTEEYNNYLKKINSYLQGKDLELENKFKIDHSSFDYGKIYIEHYLPEYRDLDEMLNNETVDSLENLTKIIKPSSSDKEGKVITSDCFSYPLPVDKLTTKGRSKTKLKKNDIIIPRNKKDKIYLVRESQTEFYASKNHFIIRVRDGRVNSAYLFFYLQSDAFKKYVLSYFPGGNYVNIRFENLKKLPIIIPDHKNLEFFEYLFTTKYLNRKEEDSISKLSKYLFNTPLPKNYVYMKLKDHLLEQTRSLKNSLIMEVIENDLNELNKCQRNNANKAALILCGSILESVLLYMISDRKGKDYINRSKPLKLSEMIKIMAKLGIFNTRLEKAAKTIKFYRNSVHPQHFLKKTLEIDNNKVEEIVKKLKSILDKILY